MALRRFLCAGMLAGALVLALTALSWGADKGTKADAETAKSDLAKVEAQFKAAFPQVPVDGIAATEIPGMYEIVSRGGTAYYYPAKDLVIAGEMYEKGLRNISAEHRQAAAAKMVKTLPLDKALKIGNGPKKVIVFTDPDCPYCRKGAEYFTKRPDTTQYIFFAPLAHPGAITKIEYILGAPNKQEAYDAMMLGQEIPAVAKPATPEVKALAQEHLALARKVGVSGTPSFFINGEMIVGSDTKKIEQLLGPPPAPAAK